MFASVVGLPSPVVAEAIIEAGRQAAAAGMSPDGVAGRVFQAIRKEQLYVFTYPISNQWVGEGMDGLIAVQNPPLPGG